MKKSSCQPSRLNAPPSFLSIFPYLLTQGFSEGDIYRFSLNAPPSFLSIFPHSSNVKETVVKNGS